MPTPLQLLNAQRRPVVVYSPGRPLQVQRPLPARAGPARAAPAPTARTRDQRREAGETGPGIDWAGFSERVQNTPAAQKQREKEAQKQAEEAAYDELPWYKQGLGMVLGNPVVSTLLKPLQPLSYLGKGMTLAVEEAAERLPDWAKGGLSAVVDTSRTEADKRSNWEKVFGSDSTYGFGELLDKDNPDWINNIAGFAGDIALDPFTYVTAGATRIPQALERTAKLERAATELEKASEWGGKLTKAVEAGQFDEVGQAATRAAEHEAMARRLTEAAPELGERVPLRQGRKARASFLGEIAEQAPELYAEHADELARAGQRGFNTIRDPALREAIGLRDPALRFMGMELPGTGRLVTEGARAGGAARALADRTPLLARAMEAFAPKGTESALATLTRGKGGDLLSAASHIRISNLLRQGTGNMEGRGNAALTQLTRQLKGKTDDEIKALFRQAEANPERNVFNQFFGHDLPDIYNKVAGREMGVKRNPDTYIPHMMTPQFKRYLKAHLQDKSVEEYMAHAGFVGDDLLEGSHFLEKSRKLAPDVVGEPKDFEIAGKTITLNDGTIDELNDQLGSVFSDFKGKAYMDDPIRIGEAYVNSVARQAGRDLALDRMAESANPLVREISGPILDAIEKRNEWARANPIVAAAKRGYRAGERLAPIKPKGPAPTSEFDDILATTKAVAETQAQRNTLMKEGKQFVEDVGKDVTKTRSTLAENIKGLRTTLMGGLQKKGDAADQQIRRINVQLDRVDAEIKKVGALTTENVDDINALTHTVDAHITDTRKEIKKIQDRYGKKIPRDQKRVEAELQKSLRRLEAQAEAIKTQYDKGAAAIRAEAKARQTALEAPVVEARRAVTQAEAKHGPRPVSNERVQAANAYIRSNFETEDAFEAERALYVQAFNDMRDNNIPIMRTIDGRLTPETSDAVQAAVSDLRKTQPSVPDVPTPEPTATVQPTSATPEQRLAEAMRQAQAEPAAAEASGAEALPAAEAPPAPPVPEAPSAPAVRDTKLVRQTDGTYASEDGFVVRKVGKDWRVILDEEEDLGAYPSLKEARAEVEHWQRQLAPTEEAAAPAVEAAAPAAAEEVAAPAAKKPPTKRITRPWKPKEFHPGHPIEEGPEGWTVEPFEQSIKRPPPEAAKGYLEPGFPGPRPPVAPLGEEAQGPRLTRYLAINKEDETLRGQSFKSARDAKLAVEDLLRSRRRKVTAEEYAARGELRLAQPEATYENLSGRREFPPSGLTPEEAAANKAAAQAVPGLQRPVPGSTMGPNELALTPEGAEMMAKRPPSPPRNVDPYTQARDEWQAELARSTDPSLTKTERAKAKRQATSMGGEFTQTTGKYHQRHAAEKIMAEDVAWQRGIDTDPAVVQARANLTKAEATADNQVEAMVYTKYHNPITGQDEYTRLPSGSMQGFGVGEERVPVPIEPPTQGQVPTGRRMEPPADLATGYTPGQRAADRAMIDSGISMMMPENRTEYDRLAARADEITSRITAADANQAELDRLDEAAKAAYTTEVRAADDAVREAKRAEAQAANDLEAGNVMGAGLAHENAQRNTQRVIEEQTAARQAWMDADKAWKDALAKRDEYLKTSAEVTRAEQALHGTTRDSDKFIAAVREGRPLPLVGGHEPSEELKKLTRNLRQAIAKQQVAEDAGMVFMTDTERRALVGVMNDIDVERRGLINQALGQRSVEPGQRVLPRRDFQAEAMEQVSNPDQYVERFGNERRTTNIPPVAGTGQEDLARRAYAESFEPTQPQTRQVWGVTEEGIPQQRTQLAGHAMYQPGTEREAIAALGKQAGAIEEGPAGQAMRQELSNIDLQREGLGVNAEQRKAEIEMAGTVERDEALLPFRDQLQTYRTVNDALKDKATLIPKREEAIAQRKVVVAAKPSKKADLVKIADDIEAVAKQNPDLLDDDMTTVEALLQDVRDEATRVADNDLNAKQVQGLIDKVGRRDDKSLDIMLTTVGRNWRMLYEANGSKKALLKEGDIIVQADLHKMFTQLYEIKKDKVLFGRTLNAFTNLFKTYATLTPGFHVRNALSAIFMNSTDGVALKTQYRAAGIWKQWMEDGEEWLATQPKKIQNAFEATFGTGAGGRFTEAGFAEIAGEGGFMDRLEKLSRNKATRWSQRVGERVEGSVRLAMAMDSMERGENVSAAIQRIDRIHFDYGEISKFDENAKRLIPFWTFMSRNMPMQVSQMWTHPKVYLRYQDFIRNFSAENEEYTPEYWTKAGAWNTGLKVPENNLPVLGAASGMPVYLQPDLGFTRLNADLTDYQDFLSGKRPGGVLSQANPLLSAPVEYLTRQDIFTGQKFEEGETVPAKGLLNLPVQALARVLGQSKGGEVDAAFANTISALNPLQDRSLRLLPQLAGNDPEARQRQAESILRVMAGAPVRTLTPKQQQNEYFRRYYELLNQQKRDREREQRAAG